MAKRKIYVQGKPGETPTRRIGPGKDAPTPYEHLKQQITQGSSNSMLPSEDIQQYDEWDPKTRALFEALVPYLQKALPQLFEQYEPKEAPQLAERYEHPDYMPEPRTLTPFDFSDIQKYYEEELIPKAIREAQGRYGRAGASVSSPSAKYAAEESANNLRRQLAALAADYGFKGRGQELELESLGIKRGHARGQQALQAQQLRNQQQAQQLDWQQKQELLRQNALSRVSSMFSNLRPYTTRVQQNQGWLPSLLGAGTALATGLYTKDPSLALKAGQMGYQLGGGGQMKLSDFNVGK